MMIHDIGTKNETIVDDITSMKQSSWEDEAKKSYDIESLQAEFAQRLYALPTNNTQHYIEEIQRTQVDELNSWLQPCLEKPPEQRDKITQSCLSFNEMWDQQEKFMKLLHEKRGLPEFPVDLSTKQGQRIVKEYVQDAVSELFEALFELKNVKTHRKTEIHEIDREHFLEEITDSLHYILEVAIYAGFTADELHQMYLRKGVINENRINNGY